MSALKPLLRLIIFLAFAVALVFAPVIPATAFVSQPGGDQALHAAHAGAANAEAACEQHDFCNDQYCAACVQCFTAALMIFPYSTYLHSIQVPIVQRLHALLGVAAHHRPPRTI